ncbi:hypothetical protein N7462_003853 [Penicillium macrosclerotiorum]|uniref:uncharacterized protein n=1 Tax=Penicillium macrosclerotiorum TaxID=303699 RepID=UPI0025465CA7|nr:uncharacterized protein N7462_003853 [Penicillium macrosclerotiorum]KAJ5689461.1 hypothetical protein N7462_003853 [Penicillium macrosclerotiorum]
MSSTRTLEAYEMVDNELNQSNARPLGHHSIIFPSNVILLVTVTGGAIASPLIERQNSIPWN